MIDITMFLLLAIVFWYGWRGQEGVSFASDDALPRGKGNKIRRRNQRTMPQAFP